MSLILTNTSDMPPGGYPYSEPTIGFDVPYGSDLAIQGLNFVAKALQGARANNPKAGLDPSFDACLDAVKRATCERLANDPKLLSLFCREAVPPALSPKVASVSKKGGCRTCGKR